MTMHTDNLISFCEEDADSFFHVQIPYRLEPSYGKTVEVGIFNQVFLKTFRIISFKKLTSAKRYNFVKSYGYYKAMCMYIDTYKKCEKRASFTGLVARAQVPERSAQSSVSSCDNIFIRRIIYQK